MTDSLHPLTETVARTIDTELRHLSLNPGWDEDGSAISAHAARITNRLLASPLIQQVAAQAKHEGVNEALAALAVWRDGRRTVNTLGYADQAVRVVANVQARTNAARYTVEGSDSLAGLKPPSGDVNIHRIRSDYLEAIADRGFADLYAAEFDAVLAALKAEWQAEALERLARAEKGMAGWVGADIDARGRTRLLEVAAELRGKGA